MERPTRRTFIAGGATAGFIGLAGCLGDDTDDDDDNDTAPPDDGDDGDDTAPPDDGDDTEPFEAQYEVWALDQGTEWIHIYEPTETGIFQSTEQIDTFGDEAQMPHMIHYSSDYEYAVIACTGGGEEGYAKTLVYRTEDRELVANLETGPGTHFAGFSPDDDAIIVDVIGESKIVKIDADLDAEEFTIADEIEISEAIDGLTEQEGAPICHSYDHSGRSIHTLGPAYGNAGVVIVDHDDFSVDVAFSGEELPANCGTMPHPTEDKFYLTAGAPTPTDDEGEPIEGEEGVGAYYVLDTETDELLVDGASTEGVDAHGFWFTPDGEELWVLNRETNDGVIVDPDTDDVIDEIDAFGPADDPDDHTARDAPDIMWADPTGEHMFVSLRGTQPRSGDPHAATGVTSGFSVIDIESRAIEDVVQVDPDAFASDVHGIGVRPFDPDASLSPPFN